MTRLGGRKFLGFALLAVVAIVCAARGVDVGPDIVTLLLGAYAVFSGSNLMAGRLPQNAAQPDVSQHVAAYLDSQLGPALQNQQQMIMALTDRLLQLEAKLQQPTAQQNKQLVEQIMQGQVPYAPRS